MPQQQLHRDRRAVFLPAHTGTPAPPQAKRVVVVGGGIAGLAAACGLVERGVAVDLIEPEDNLGGRVRSWRTTNAAGDVTMSRGFHAFFRQYYNLRKLLTRAGDLTQLLRPVDDYPVVSSSGDRDSFTKIPRTPPWNFITFVLRSPTFTARDLAKVDLDTALSLLDVDFPDTYRQLDGLSAADFLDQLHFPDRARHLALEVFARSFFADPRDFSAAELVAMFHSYFLGSAEGLLFDVPKDDFNSSLWGPLGEALEQQGMKRVRGSVQQVEQVASTGNWRVQLTNGDTLEADALVLAAGPQATADLVSKASFSTSSRDVERWRQQVVSTAIAPPFAVLRLWLNGSVRHDRPAFLGTANFGLLDNISVLERFEDGAKTWAKDSGGSVVELHAYSLPREYWKDGHTSVESQQAIAAELRTQLERVYPETAALEVTAQELLIDRDCALIGTDSWDQRPTTTTPVDGLVLAGDWVRCDLPIALMERAATTGWMAANHLLEHWGVAGHDLWSVPVRGRHWWPRKARKLMSLRPGQQSAQ